jgi:hypothetical protein
MQNKKHSWIKRINWAFGFIEGFRKNEFELSAGCLKLPDRALLLALFLEE